MTTTSTVYEPIMNALVTFLKANCSADFPTIRRRFITWENLIQLVAQDKAPFAQPCMIIYDGIGFGGGKVVYDPRGRGTPGVRTMHRTLVIYAQAPGGGTPAGPDDTTPGGTVFASLVESIENAFNAATDSEGACTLGRTVSHCWISGESHWLTPDIDPNGQGMLTVPVQIMIP